MDDISPSTPGAYKGKKPKIVEIIEGVESGGWSVSQKEAIRDELELFAMYFTEFRAQWFADNDATYRKANNKEYRELKDSLVSEALKRMEAITKGKETK